MLTLTCTITFAGPVSREEAQQKAAEFLQSKFKKSVKGGMKLAYKAPSLHVTDNNSSFYIFNVGSKQGYVVVSGDDATQDILGYSDSGDYDANNVPEGLKAWLEAVKTCVEKVSLSSSTAYSGNNTSIHKTNITNTKYPIPALMKSKWNQGEPYNNLCPKLGSNLCATGCVATAIAQVMYYHKWPQEATQPIEGYTTNTNYFNIASLPSITFNWDKMLDEYTSSSPAESKKAVSEIMQYVGSSVRMDYGPASGAYSENIASALINKFGYDKGIRYLESNNYTYKEWEDKIYDELVAGRPVLMDAMTSSNSGHEFVVDGYDGNGYYHMNWGWGGMSDGFFLLTIMNPGLQGTGGSEGSYDGFSIGQGIVVGVQRPIENSQAEKVRLQITNIWTNDKVINRASADADFNNIRIHTALKSSMSFSNYEAGIALYNSSNQLVKVLTFHSVNLPPAYSYSDYIFNGFFGKGLADGEYTLKSCSREKGKTEWNLSIGADKYYILATISGNTLTLKGMPNVDLKINSLEIDGPKKIGSKNNLSINITNNGDEFYDRLYLFENGKLATGAGFAIPENSTKTFDITYFPRYSGDVKLSISRNRMGTNKIFETTKHIEAFGSNASLSITSRALNMNSNSKIYGNDLDLELEIKNNTSNKYTSYVNAMLYAAPPGSKYLEQHSSIIKNVTIEGNDIQKINVKFENLDFNTEYYLYTSFQEGRTEESKEQLMRTYKLSPCHVAWDANGNKSYSGDIRTPYTVPENAVAVVLYGSESAKKAVPNSNPNCIYYFNEGVRPNGSFDDKNVVVGETAENIILTDAKSFYIPKNFKAKNITYTRQFGNAENGNAWTTLCVPFDVKSVSENNSALDWFHKNDDKDKNFVIQSFLKEAGNNLIFICANEIKANRPYILSTAGNYFGNDYDINNKTVTFTGTDSDVKTSDMMSVYGFNYKFVGANSDMSVKGKYVLSADGKTFNFVEGEQATTPFMAYFLANNDDAETVKTLYVKDFYADPTGINNTVDNADKTVIIYNIDGIKVRKAKTTEVNSVINTLPKGVYVVEGKKFVN